MSDNLISPLVDTLYNSCNILIKSIKNVLGANTVDFNKLFEETNLLNKSKEKPKLHEKINQEYFTIYRFSIPLGITIDDFIKREAHFKQILNADITIEKYNYYIDIKVLKGIPKAEYDPIQHKRGDFKIPLGYDLNNDLVLWDFTRSSNAHCYIASSSGGGKSIQLRVILCHLVNSLSKREIEFSIVNTKRVDLKDFQYCKHTKNYQVGTDGIETFLENELEEMERRYKIIENNNCDDLSELRKQGYRIPFRLIVIEEISAYKDNKTYQSYITKLASMGRGAGMLLLMVTQLPSHEIMPNTIKCNVNTIIGLKTIDEIRSDIIVPNGKLHKLKGEGHAKLFDSTHDGTEYQGLYIDKETMKDIIKANLNQNKRAVRGATPTTHDDNKI